MAELLGAQFFLEAMRETRHGRLREPQVNRDKLEHIIVIDASFDPFITKASRRPGLSIGISEAKLI